jgi:hypothetical protein
MSNATPTPRALTVTGSNPRIPQEGRRNPIVFVDLTIGQDWGTTIAVQHQHKAGLVIRLPIAADGGPGIRPSASLLQAMTQAAGEAVKADPAAYEHLTKPHPAQRRKVGGKRLRAEGE